jgi:hypothetical protein
MPPPAASGAKSKLSVKLTEGLLRAIARREGTAAPTRQAIEAECARLGVVHGLDATAIDRLCAGRVPAGTDVVIAQGVAPKPGSPSRIEYAFVLPKENVAFTSVEGDARVDFREGLLNSHVVAGTVVARKITGRPGTPGKSVTGQSIPAPEPPEPSLVAGENVRLDEGGTTAIATSDGLATLDGDRVVVIATCTVRAVNYASGNIHFDGPVIVRGDVEPGFSVSATGDIEIQGMVEGARILSGGNVIVRGGVRNNAHIEAVGSVAVRFVDSGATVRACGDVQVVTNAIRSSIAAGRQVTIGDTVSGAEVLAGTRIEVGEAGGESAVKTTLEIRRDATDERLSKLRTALSTAETASKILDRAPPVKASNLARREVSALKRLNAEQVQAHVMVRLVRARLGLAGQWRVQDSFAGEVLARRKVHRGVRVVIHGSTASHRDVDGGAQFRFQPPAPEGQGAV